MIITPEGVKCYMPTLIDGHNLIPKLGLRLDSFDDELELVERLNEFCRLARKTQVEVYFDNAQPGYAENRRVLIEGLPKAGLSRFLPADGAFYLYADVSDFTDDSFAFAQRMLHEAHVAATPGVDFDPFRGRAFLRLSYARSTSDMHEAVGRIARWLERG